VYAELAEAVDHVVAGLPRHVRENEVPFRPLRSTRDHGEGADGGVVGQRRDHWLGQFGRRRDA
jgi:hypothetical protein